MDNDTWRELDEIEGDLRQKAAQLQQTAEGMRRAAVEHDARAIGLLEAADRLRKIERPQ